MWKQKQLNICGSGSTLKKEARSGSIWLFCGAGSGSIFHKTWDRNVEAELKADKFLWKWKHFEEKSWKQKQSLKRLTLYRAESRSKKCWKQKQKKKQKSFHIPGH